MSASLVGLLAFGFVMGMRHATDADHVVAVNAIVARSGRVRSAALVGAFWGLGHTLTIVLVGGAIVMFGLVVPPRLGLSMELGVAVMLVVLGVANVVSAGRHVHDTATGAHAHPEDVRVPARLAFLRPLIVGVVHGLAGSAAVALLVLGTLKDARWAMAYLAVFGVGTIAGMTLLTTLVAMPMLVATRRFPSAERWLGRVTGALSIALGLYLAYEIGVVQGLFGASPTWTPG